MEPTLLIASPHLVDRNFSRTVVLVWGHEDDDRVVGVVVNRKLERRAGARLKVGAELDLADHTHVPVVWGGPVEPELGTVVTCAPLGDQEGKALGSGIAVTQSLPTLVRLLREQEEFMLCLGHAGWDVGQLDQEIEQGSWLFTDLSPALLFETPTEERYDRALATLGLAAKTMWMPPVSE